MMIYKNANGQDAAEPYIHESDPHLNIDPLDLERCQTVFMFPTRIDGQIKFNGRRCDRQPVCVMVENNPRSSHGKIHSMTVCEQCAKGVLIAQGPDYALFTPLG